MARPCPSRGAGATFVAVSGNRRLAWAPLDELVGAPEVGDPRIRFKPRVRNGRLVFPLMQQSSGVAVWKVVIPPERERARP